MSTFSEILKRERENKGYSKAELARKLNIPYTTYQNYENGREPKIDVIKQISEELGINPSVFFDLENRDPLYERNFHPIDHSEIECIMLYDSGKFEYMKIDVGKQAMNGREEDFEWIEFYASAFQIGSTIYIYPTYEFAENKKPCGNDSFSFLLGEAIRPYEFGGTLWDKDNTMSDWAVSGNLIANNQQLNGASYSGSQLGTPRSAMKFMGTTYCHASVGTGNDNRIVMGYSYQPKKVRVELFGWRLSRKQIIFVLAGGVVVGSVWWRKNKGKTQK